MTAMKSVLYVMGLLVAITYVFAIALNMLSEGTEFRDAYFFNVPIAMYFLLIHGTFLDDLADFADAIRAESPLCLLLVGIFIYFSSLTVMNMLIGVLCEVVSSVTET